MKHSPRFLTLVDETRPRVTSVSPDEVREQIEGDGPLVLVDVREASEWSGGHLPGALHLARGVLERDVERALPDPETPIVLYCGGGYRSTLAADTLQRMGYTHVSSMDGGWRAWTEAGYPTEGGPEGGLVIPDAASSTE